MKNLLLLILFTVVFKILSAQNNIVGRWHYGPPSISNLIHENYCFFDDGTFCFNTDIDDQLSRVSKMGGTYKIVDHKIIFIATYYIEKIGGYLTLNKAEPGDVRWGFEEVKVNKVQIEKPIEEEVPLVLYKKQNVEILEVGSLKYYKIQDDPNKY